MSYQMLIHQDQTKCQLAESEGEVVFLSVAIILIFGIGTATGVSVFMSSSWIWMIPSYVLGSFIGLGFIWLAYALPIRRIAPPDPSKLVAKSEH